MAVLEVAIVDDEEPVRKALDRLLRASGMVAHSFPSGQTFLDSIVTTRPDCLILDLHMPGLTGLQVLEKLRSCRPPLPTIVISGHDEPENQVRCLAVGASAYLRKPIDDQMLLHTIDEAVHGRGRPVA
jgi:FixJ family two-component response regulator